METEMSLLRENYVWDLVKLPPGKRTVGYTRQKLEQMDWSEIQSEVGCIRFYATA